MCFLCCGFLLALGVEKKTRESGRGRIDNEDLLKMGGQVEVSWG